MISSSFLHWLADLYCGSQESLGHHKDVLELSAVDSSQLQSYTPGASAEFLGLVKGTGSSMFCGEKVESVQPASIGHLHSKSTARPGMVRGQEEGGKAVCSW